MLCAQDVGNDVSSGLIEEAALRVPRPQPRVAFARARPLQRVCSGRIRGRVVLFGRG